MINNILDELITKKVIFIEGDLTANRVNELKTLIVEALSDLGNLIVIDLKNVKHIDINCLHLLCSAHRTAINLKKNLVLKQNKTDKFKNILQETGFNRVMGCAISKDKKSCLWINKQ